MPCESNREINKTYLLMFELVYRASLPSNDSNSWYYPAHFENTSEEEDVLSVRATQGNWGRKQYKSSRWMRKGKNAPWGPGKYEWEVCLFTKAAYLLAFNDPYSLKSECASG